MNLYNETMALEELTEEAIHTLGPDARDVLTQIRYSSLLCAWGQPSCDLWYVEGYSCPVMTGAGSTLTQRSILRRIKVLRWERAPLWH
jgi:hypothetical protein